MDSHAINVKQNGHSKNAFSCRYTLFRLIVIRSKTIMRNTSYQRALQLVLQHEGKIADKEDWIKQASTTPIYQYSKVITRFLIFCASEDTIANETEKGLVKLGRPGINPMLTLNRWNDKAYFTVEHVAPQSRNANWGDDIYNDIYNDSRNVNTLGNLTLLPQEENNAIGNKSWTHKKLMYSLLSAKTQEEFDNLQTQLPNVGLNLRKSANEVLTNAKYLGLCKSVALYDKDWSLCLIEKRTRSDISQKHSEVSIYQWSFNTRL